MAARASQVFDPDRLVGLKGGTAALHQTPGGEGSWTEQTAPGASCQAVAFVDADHGWAVGTSGKIVATANGGASWASQTSGTQADPYGISFTDVETSCDENADCPMSDGFGGCEDAQCLPSITACIPTTNYLDCASVCEASAQTCVEGGCGGSNVWFFESPAACMSGPPGDGLAAPCDQLFAQHVETVARCCCQ